MYKQVPGYATLQETTSPGSVSVKGSVSLFGNRAARGLGCACDRAPGLGFAPGAGLFDDAGGIPWWVWALGAVGVLWLVTHPSHTRAEKRAELAYAKAGYLRRRARVKRAYSVRGQAAEWVGV
ncbi:MAG: hypothetical protein IPK75_20275 [Acidobacteria bacterium]|nr:hypothetical protein [Acidobacteriota bacterium]